MPLARVQTAIISKLRELGRLSEEEAEEIINSPEEMSGSAMETLLQADYDVSEFQILVAKSKAFSLNPFNARNFKSDERTFEYLDREFCREQRILPVGAVGDCIVVALSDPFNLNVTNKIQEITRKRVFTLLALERDIIANLEEDQNTEQEIGFGDVVEALGIEYELEEGEFGQETLEEESAPIIQLANRIIEEAYYSGGSDIHIEPFENQTRVRVRIDGICQEKLTLPNQIASPLMSRIKVMANLDIAEKRLPQDGRIVFKQYNKKGIDVDLRVSTAPLNHGEGAVMRILDKQKSTLPLEALGFSEANLSVYRSLITRPYGMILHCGPTGSGKSMSMYSALNEINKPDLCIRTAEDPIEYTLPGLCQMQMNRKIGLTFGVALRAYLRQDPDIILVGEIRDHETAGIAIEAALTGHMLFTTLHTNDAPGTVSRLTDMGIEPFMISASLVCVCAQRLLRRVCTTCRQHYSPEGNELQIISQALDWEGQIFRANPKGCPACGESGMKDRVGIHELMATSEELVKGINDGLEAVKIKDIARASGMSTLHQDSMMKVRDGITTMEEAIATVPPDL